MYRFFRHSFLLTCMVASTVTLKPSVGQALPKVLPQAVQASSVQNLVSEWHNFVSSEGGYSVLMPTPPVAFMIPGDPYTTPVQMFMQMRLANSETMELYGIAFVDYVGDLNTPELTQQALLGCQEPFNPGDRLIRSRPMRLGSYEGIESEFQTMVGGLSITQCYLVGQRFYMLLTMAEPFSIDSTVAPSSGETISTARSETMDQFLNSFQLLNR